MSESLEIVPAQQGLARVTVEDFLPLMTVQQAIDRKSQVNQFITGVLREDEDFGKIPGGQQKPVLLKPGAEKLCSIFGLAACYLTEQITEDWHGNDHAGEPFFYYRYKCQLWRGDRMMGEAIGSCNSWESKYRYRNSNRKCPTCGAEAIIQGKAEYGGGWVCFKKKGGCGAKFEDNDESITSQVLGRVANTDVADQVNTLQKMAQKRALVAAVLVVTNCSDAFTQDIEDMPQPASSDAPRHTEEARTPEPPAALRVLFENLEKPGGTKHALETMLAKLKEFMPVEGENAYRKIVEQNGLRNKGAKVCQVKVALLQIWSLIELAQASQPSGYQATDEDLPAGLFDKEAVTK